MSNPVPPCSVPVLRGQGARINLINNRVTARLRITPAAATSRSCAMNGCIAETVLSDQRAWRYLRLTPLIKKRRSQSRLVYAASDSDAPEQKREETRWSNYR